jgi:hypothetical protein
MIAADVLRAGVLIPVSIAALAGDLPLWALVVAAFLLTTGASYFDPAYGALLPALVDRSTVQQANGLVRSTADAATVAGWAAAAGLLAVVPLGTFFAINAASFVISAALVARVARPIGRVAHHHAEAPRVRDGFAALRPLPVLALAVLLFGVCVTLSSGTWIVGVPQLVRKALGHGAGAFSLVAASYALGSVVAGLVLARWRIRRKALVGIAAWMVYLPAYGLFAVAHSLGTAVAAGALCGIGQGSAWVLVNAAAQEEVPDRVLGRVMGLISLVHRGAHATGLLFVSPLFAVVAARAVFGAAGITLAGIGALGTAFALALDRRQRAAFSN